MILETKQVDDRIVVRLDLNDDDLKTFCPTGQGGGVDPSCSPGQSGGVGHPATNFDNPSPDLLRRTHLLLAEINEDSAFDAQMRGGKLRSNGTFVEFTPEQKNKNLGRIVNRLKQYKENDPDAFEAARQWAIAESFGVKNYSELPDEVDVHRGHDDSEKLGKVINVTTKRDIAEKFGESGVVSSWKINKGDITFPLANSVFSEGELIINRPTKVMKLAEQKVSKYAERARWLTTLKPGHPVRTSDGEGTLVQVGVGNTAVVKLKNGEIDYAAYVLRDE